jgi:hypothetical protein
VTRQCFNDFNVPLRLLVAEAEKNCHECKKVVDNTVRVDLLAPIMNAE